MPAADGAGGANGVGGPVAPAATASTAVSLDAPLDDLTIPARLRAALRRGGITTIGDLVARTSPDLLELTGVGPGSVEDIRAKLAERGLTLLGEPPVPGVPAEAAPAGPAPTEAITPAPTPDAITPALAPTGATPPGPAPITPAPAPGATPDGSMPSQSTVLSTGNGAGPAATTTTQPRRRAAKTADAEPEAINLLKVAGLPVLKRALPVLAGLTAALVIALRHRIRRRRS